MTYIIAAYIVLALLVGLGSGIALTVMGLFNFYLGGGK